MNTAHAYAVPTLREELDRKTLETIEKVVTEAQRGRTTAAQYAYAIEVLFSVTAGLVDNDFVTMLSTMDKGVKEGSFFTREYYRSEKGDIAKVTNMHDGRVKMELSLRDSLHVSDKLYDFRPEIGGTQRAQEKFQALCDTLIAKGFSEI